MAALLRALEATNRSATPAVAPDFAAAATEAGTAHAPPSAATAVDVRMFDKTLRGYEEAGKWKQALGLLRRMMMMSGDDANSSSYGVGVGRGGVLRPDASTFGLVVSTCAKAGRWREATNLVLREMPARKVIPEARTFAALIDACGKWGRWKDAVDLLDAMVNAGLTPTVATYNNALTLCCGGGRSRLAMDILDRMLATGVTPNVASYNSAMTACEHVGEWRETLGLLRKMEAMPGVRPNVRSYNIAIKAVGDGDVDRGSGGDEQGGDCCETALALFREMSAAGITPNTDSYTSVIRVAFSRAGRIDETVLGLLEELSESMKSTSIAAAADTITICGTAIDANPSSSAHRGRGAGVHASKNWRHAVGLLREVEGRAVQRSPVTSEAGVFVVGGRGAEGGSSELSDEEEEKGDGGVASRVCAPRRAQQQQKKQQALSRLKDMSGAEIPQTVGSYSLAITQCGHGGRWEEALALLRQMAAVGIPPSRKCYHSAIAACGGSRRHEEALKLLRELPKAGFPLTEKSYRCAISALGNAGGQSEKCVALLREARAAGLPPSPGSYSLAIMACGDAGRWEEALFLLREAEALDIADFNGACYNAAVKACKDCGRPEEAAAVLARSETEERRFS